MATSDSQSSPTEGKMGQGEEDLDGWGWVRGNQRDSGENRIRCQKVMLIGSGHRQKRREQMAARRKKFVSSRASISSKGVW